MGRSRKSLMLLSLHIYVYSHCRICGKCICDSCSQHRITISDMPNIGKVRCCSECYKHHANSDTVSSSLPILSSVVPNTGLFTYRTPDSSPNSTPPASPRGKDTHTRAPPTAMPISRAIPTAAPIQQHKEKKSFFDSVFGKKEKAHPVPTTHAALPPITVATHTTNTATTASTTTPSPSSVNEQEPGSTSTPSIPIPSNSKSKTVTPPSSFTPPAPISVSTPASTTPSTTPPSTITSPISPPVEEQTLRHRNRSHSHSKKKDHSGSASESKSETIKLDLPLKLCLVILKKTAAEMKEKYLSYKQTKKERHEEDILTFHQFMFFSTIRTLPNFLFLKTELSYCLMREEGQQMVYRDSFLRYAPILSPLASKIDVERVYDALELASSGGTAATGTSGGIGFVQFKAYVDALKKQIKMEEEEWPEFRTAFNLDKKEQLLLIRTGVTDTSSFPPQVGRIGIGSYHFFFETSIFHKRRCWSWAQIHKIERNDTGMLRKHDGQQGFKLHVVEEEPIMDEHGTVIETRKKETVLILDIVGFGHDVVLERTHTFQYIYDMITAHRLASQQSDKLVASAILQETFETIRRMRALEGISVTVQPLLLSPFRNCSTADEVSYISSLNGVLNKHAAIKKSKSHWLYSVLPGLQTDGGAQHPSHKSSSGKEEKNNEQTDDIDPEWKFEYKTMDELNKRVDEKEPFSLKAFGYNVKLFRAQIEPFLAFYRLLKQLRNWENPYITFMTIALLLNMAYRDNLCYLPAIFILCHIILLLVFKYSPDSVSKWLGTDMYGREEEEWEEVDPSTMAGTVPLGNTIIVNPSPITPPSDVSASGAALPIASPHNPASSVVSGVSRWRRKIKEEESGLLAKLKNYRNVAMKTKDHLESLQHSIHDANVKLMKYEGLYKWRSPVITNKFLMILCGVFLALVFVPFRFIFPLIGNKTNIQIVDAGERMRDEIVLIFFLFFFFLLCTSM